MTENRLRCRSATANEAWKTSLAWKTVPLVTLSHTLAQIQPVHCRVLKEHRISFLYSYRCRTLLMSVCRGTPSPRLGARVASALQAVAAHLELRRILAAAGRSSRTLGAAVTAAAAAADASRPVAAVCAAVQRRTSPAAAVASAGRRGGHAEGEPPAEHAGRPAARQFYTSQRERPGSPIKLCECQASSEPLAPNMALSLVMLSS